LTRELGSTSAANELGGIDRISFARAKMDVKKGWEGLEEFNTPPPPSAMNVQMTNFTFRIPLIFKNRDPEGGSLDWGFVASGDEVSAFFNPSPTSKKAVFC